MFKVGDRIRRKAKWRSDMIGQDGKVVLVTKVVDYLYDSACYFITSDGKTGKGYQKYFELVEEENVNTFDLKTMPWQIVTNSREEFNTAQEWLFEQGIFWLSAPREIRDCFRLGHILTNVNIENEACHYMMWTSSYNKNVPEIKITFKPLLVDKVEYPVVESLKDKEISLLRKEMEKLAERIKILKAE